MPAGSLTSLPSVAAIVPPPPIRTPSSAPFDAAEDAADDRADAGAGADLPDLALDAFALERLRDGAAHRIVAAVDRDLIERDRQAALALGARRLRVTELTTPRIVEPAGISTWSP